MLGCKGTRFPVPMCCNVVSSSDSLLTLKDGNSLPIQSGLLMEVDGGQKSAKYGRKNSSSTTVELKRTTLSSRIAPPSGSRSMIVGQWSS